MRSRITPAGIAGGVNAKLNLFRHRSLKETLPWTQRWALALTEVCGVFE